MIGLIQRVIEARVEIDGAIVGAIERGLLVFVCAEPADDDSHADRFVARLLKLRVFADTAGRMNRSVQDIGGGLLVVPQFTLAADTSGGNRPSFTAAAPAELGQRLYERMVALARERHPKVACGVFGATMLVALVNDGPVTIPLRVV